MAVGCEQWEQLRLAFTRHPVNDVYIDQGMKGMAIFGGRSQGRLGLTENQ